MIRTRVKRRSKKINREFSKNIVIWAIWVTTLYIIAGMIEYYIFLRDVSDAITSLITIIVTGVIVSYAAKAGVENYSKIKNADCAEGTPELTVDTQIDIHEGEVNNGSN